MKKAASIQTTHSQDLSPQSIQQEGFYLGMHDALQEQLAVYYIAHLKVLLLILTDKSSPAQIIKIEERAIDAGRKPIKPIGMTVSENGLHFTYQVKGQYQTTVFSLLNFFTAKVPFQSPFKRCEANPIIAPFPENGWESILVYNPGVIDLDGTIHFVYRATGHAWESVFGHASSQDGIKMDERSKSPIFLSEHEKANIEEFDPLALSYSSGGSWKGCEDPRLTRVGDTIYMTYTLFNGVYPPSVALTSIKVSDFINKNWNWTRPKQISPPHQMHKNWVIFPEKIQGKFAVMHSISPTIKIDYFDSLDFKPDDYIESRYQPSERKEGWETWVRGVGSPPIKMEEGWLVFYHAMDKKEPHKYKIGAMVLDLYDPKKVLMRAPGPVLEPSVSYELEGYKPNIIYTCGAVLRGQEVFLYYGASDNVVCLAKANLRTLVSMMQAQ